MLTDLTIKNFAIIETLHVPFHQGLTVLTGETGAGKSIIIDAVTLILGGRASADLVRTGEEEATVEGLFDVSGHPALMAALADMGIDCYGELLVKRVVSRAGRNRIFINGGMATQAVLADLTRRLINIYGQHESQTLLRPENHLSLLDGFARLGPAVREFSTLHDEYRTISDSIRDLEEGEREAARRLDLLTFQAEEIGTAGLTPGEEEELQQERQLLVHAEKLSFHSQRAFELLYGGDETILGRLQQAAADVGAVTAIDATLAGPLSSLQDASIQLEDAALSLRDYAAGIESDPLRLQAVDDRLDLLARLKRKYGATVDEVIEYGRSVERELQQVRQREESRQELDRALVKVRERLLRAGEELSRSRRDAAGQLQETMARQLADLAMKHARLTVAFTPLTEPRPTGYDRVEFLFSANPGEEPRPLAKIASGGELSRLMLAIKQVHPESDVPTLVFDEVDTGIGGATSALVGEKLKRVAAGQQVLCITHLPQVAAYADHHYRVEKRVENGRTVTAATVLGGEERVAEMARMLGGVRITGTTLEHAREMIENARS